MDNVEGLDGSSPRSTKRPPQEQALALGMLYGTTPVVEYDVFGNKRFHRNSHLSDNEFDGLVAEFHIDPFSKLENGRNNLLAILGDEKEAPRERERRASRYTDTYLDLNIKLDRAAFPPDDRVIQAVPGYIPDGLSDMGGDGNTDNESRSRERIRINKKELFKQAQPLFKKVLTIQETEGKDTDEWESDVVSEVMDFVYTSMPYNFGVSENAESVMYGTVMLSDIADQKLAVCRHHALVTQVLLQSLGITSRLMKSYASFDGMPPGAHANNAVEIDGKWYLLDTTNPESGTDGKPKPYIKAIPENDLEFNNNKYTWKFDDGNGRTREYQSRSNMYYRIRDNAKES